VDILTKQEANGDKRNWWGIPDRQELLVNPKKSA